MLLLSFLLSSFYRWFVVAAWYRLFFVCRLFRVQAYEFDTGNEQDDKLTRELINELVSGWVGHNRAASGGFGFVNCGGPVRALGRPVCAVCWICGGPVGSLGLRRVSCVSDCPPSQKKSCALSLLGLRVCYVSVLCAPPEITCTSSLLF